MELTFNALRTANLLRLPLFTNKQGERAYSRPDGSDWSPCQWLKAVMGELGELAQVRRQFDERKLTFAEFAIKAAKEIADVQTYLDIAAVRILDITSECPFDDSESQTLVDIMATLGDYCNTSKKFDRREMSRDECEDARGAAIANLRTLVATLESTPCVLRHPADDVLYAHDKGVNLGEATISKFNEVSERVGCDVRLGDAA
jgi:NTP pyrophosphatase (non-canonical NTP hydrolase)